MPTNKQLSSIIILLIVLAGLRGILYSVLIPFDQSPDEGYHFRLIKSKQWELRQVHWTERQQLTAHLEWSIYYILNPEAGPTKRTIANYAGAKMLKPPPSSQIYYWSMAWILRVLALEHIRDELYVVRGISVFCGVLVVTLAYLVTRELFPADQFLQIGVPMLITFTPQFAAMNGVVNNDKITEVCIAAVFWVMVKIFKDHALWSPYTVLYLILTGIALLGKRTAIFMLPFIPISLLVYSWKGRLRWQLHLLIAGLLLGMLLAMFGMMEWIMSSESFLKEYMVSVSARKVLASLWQQWYTKDFLIYCVKFFVVLYWSFWALFGYMTVRLHYVWYLLAASAHGVAGIGLITFMWRVKRQKILVPQWKTRVLYLCGLSILLVLWLTFFRAVILRPDQPFLEQGRRLFLIIIPISVLTVLGIKTLFPPAAQRFAGALGLGGLVLLDTICLVQYILLDFQFRAFF